MLHQVYHLADAPRSGLIFVREQAADILPELDEDIREEVIETLHTDDIAEVLQELDSDDATASSALHTGEGDITNVAVQDICPLDTSEHLMVGTVDPVTYALVMDALNHPGPAEPSRISRSVCSQLVMPYVDPLDLNTILQPLESIPGLVSTPLPDLSLVGAPTVPAEPALRTYVYAHTVTMSLPHGQTAAPNLQVHHQHPKHHHKHHRHHR